LGSRLRAASRFFGHGAASLWRGILGRRRLSHAPSEYENGVAATPTSDEVFAP
jgi:hypothetical protein